MIKVSNNCILSVEGKCGVGKSTWLRERGVHTEETVDFKIDERTHNYKAGMIPLEEQLEFVTHKIEQFEFLLDEIDYYSGDVYIDGSMLYNVAYGAGYYRWYFNKIGKTVEGDVFVRDYLNKCYKLIDSTLPKIWTAKLVSIILIPEHEQDATDRVLKRGRPSEVANIENVVEVDNCFMFYLYKVLNHYNIAYSEQIIKNRVE